MGETETQEIKRLAARLQSVIETAIDGIITIDRNGIIETINKAGASLFGYHPDEVIGQNVKMLMPSDHSRKHDDYIHRYQKTGEARVIGIGREVRGKRKDGSYFTFKLAISEVKVEGQISYTGIIHDISEFKEAEQRIVALNQELERKVEARTDELELVINRLLKANQTLKKQETTLQEALKKERELNDLKSRFVSTASHEFRTPLSTIQSSASLIERYKESEQQEKRVKHIERIKNSVHTLTNILDDFLSLSKLDEGRLNLKIEVFHLNVLIEKVIEDISPILKDEQEILFEGSQDVEIQSDRSLLKNIFLNLISNAIKYSDNGAIHVRLLFEDEEIIISVEDSGIGIPAGEQKFLFDRFFRATNAINVQGTGLGLNIVKQHLDLLGGSISFKSVEGKGTTFYIRIPKS